MHPMHFREVARSVSEEAVQSEHRFGRQPTQRPRDRVANEKPNITILVAWNEPDFFDEAECLACDELTIGWEYLFTEAAGFMPLVEYEWDTPQFYAMLDSSYDVVYDTMWNMLDAVGHDPSLGTVPPAYQQLMDEHIHTVVFAVGKIMNKLAEICTGFSPPRAGMFPLHTYIDNAEIRPGVGLYIGFDFVEYQGQ